MRAQRGQGHQTRGKPRNRTHLLSNTAGTEGDVGTGRSREPKPMRKPAWQHMVKEEV